jgi:hypothetical protein
VPPSFVARTPFRLGVSGLSTKKERNIGLYLEPNNNVFVSLDILFLVLTKPILFASSFVSLCTFFKVIMVLGFRLFAEIFSGFIVFFLYFFVTPRAVPRQFRAQVPLHLGEADVSLAGRALFNRQLLLSPLGFES